MRSQNIKVGEAPRRVVVNQERNIVYVSNQDSGTISVIDGSKNNVIDTIEVSQPYEMTMDSNRNKVYVTYFGTGMLSVIDEPLQIQVSNNSFQVLIGIIIIIAIASIASAFFIRKKQIQS